MDPYRGEQTSPVLSALRTEPGPSRKVCGFALTTFTNSASRFADVRCGLIATDQLSRGRRSLRGSKRAQHSAS